MELDSVDGFVGPFSWRTRSLQDMSFPHSDGDEEGGNRTESRHCRDLSNDYFTLEALREKLRRDYIEAQEQREKYRHMLSTGGSKSIQRTEESVEFMSRKSGPGRSFKIPCNRFPLSTLAHNIEDKPSSLFSPLKKKTVYEEGAYSISNGISDSDILDFELDIGSARRISSGSEADEPETRLTVKQISEGLDKVLFRTKSPGVSPVAPTTDDVIDFLKNW